MPPFEDDIVGCPNEVRLVRILRNKTFWFPHDIPTRASSGAFFDGSKQNSCFKVDILLPEHFRKIEDKYPESKLAVITAGEARTYGYTVCDDPDDFLPGHMVICPPEDVKSSKYRKMAEKLAALSKIYNPNLINP